MNWRARFRSEPAKATIADVRAALGDMTPLERAFAASALNYSQNTDKAVALGVPLSDGSVLFVTTHEKIPGYLPLFMVTARGGIKMVTAAVADQNAERLIPMLPILFVGRCAVCGKAFASGALAFTVARKQEDRRFYCATHVRRSFYTNPGPFSYGFCIEDSFDEADPVVADRVARGIDTAIHIMMEFTQWTMARVGPGEAATCIDFQQTVREALEFTKAQIRRFAR